MNENGEWSKQLPVQKIDNDKMVLPGVGVVPIPVAKVNDWIEWDGGKRPADVAGKLVEVKFRSNAPLGIEPSGSLRWVHLGMGGDIVAYRIASEATP